MTQILKGLQTSPMVLKGGTALLFCYSLDRHSEDLDFDSPVKLNLKSKIMTSAKQGNITITNLNLVKDTNTTSRYKLSYSSKGINGRLKIEIKNGIVLDNPQIINGIRTYSINTLFDMKLRAADLDTGRAQIRDLYDLGFILKNHKADLNNNQLSTAEKFSQNLSKHKELFLDSHRQDKILKNISFDNMIKNITNAFSPKNNHTLSRNM
jgi:predicted nucleotidyltransferase component of viral defense system